MPPGSLSDYRGIYKSPTNKETWKLNLSYNNTWVEDQPSEPSYVA